MDTWGVGYPLGMATGLAIGLIYSGRIKPWSELSSKQRKIRIGLISITIILLVAAIVTMSVT